MTTHKGTSFMDYFWWYILLYECLYLCRSPDQWFHGAIGLMIVRGTSMRANPHNAGDPHNAHSSSHASSDHLVQMIVRVSDEESRGVVAMRELTLPPYFRGHETPGFGVQPMWCMSSKEHWRLCWETRRKPPFREGRSLFRPAWSINGGIRQQFQYDYYMCVRREHAKRPATT